MPQRSHTEVKGRVRCHSLGPVQGRAVALPAERATLTRMMRVGAEPYLNVNAGTGTAEEAANWVEYCNRRGRNRCAAMRALYNRTAAVVANARCPNYETGS